MDMEARRQKEVPCKRQVEATNVSRHLEAVCTSSDMSEVGLPLVEESKVISPENKSPSMSDCPTHISNNTDSSDFKKENNDENITEETCKTQYYNHQSCFLCNTPFIGGLKVVHLVLSRPMRWSSLSPLSLMRCFGMQVPSLERRRGCDICPVDVCGSCYIVISDCDILYPHICSLVSKILSMWPEKLIGFKMLCLNISFPDDGSKNFQRVPVQSDSSVTPLVTRKYKSNQCRRKKLNSSQELSFLYSHLPSGLSVEMNNINVGNGNGYIVEEFNDKIKLNELFTCGFCGMPFSSELEWSGHSTGIHKIIEKWLYYERQMVLKRNIMNEVSEINMCKTKSRGRKHLDSLSIVESCKCHACDTDLDSKAELVQHLHNVHDITVESCVKEKHDEKSDHQTHCKDEVSESLADRTEEEIRTDENSGVKSNRGKSKLTSELQQNSKNIEIAGLKLPGSKGSVKKDYAPHWRCRICGMLFSSQIVLTKHKQQTHPDTARIIKRKIHSDYSLEVDKELSFDYKEASNASRKRKHVKASGQLVNNDLGYCVVLKGDGLGGVIDHRVKLSEDSVQAKVDTETVQDCKSRKKSVKDVVTCGMCGEEFGNHVLIAEHSCPGYENSSTHESNEVVLLECKFCGRRLQGVNSMRTHMARSHSYPFKKRDRKYQCKVCPFKTLVRSQFSQHMRERHKRDVEPPVKCTKCDKMYSAQYIARHIAIIHGSSDNKKYSCKFCSMKYHDLNYLKRHIYFDHANTKWKCHICGLEFDKYHRLQQHRVNAHGTEVHKCADCDKAFKRKGDLTAHIKRSHVTKIPSVCTFCSKAYAEPTNLRTHLMKKHGVAWEDTLSKRYARHQQESQCLRRRDAKELQLIQSGKKHYLQDQQNKIPKDNMKCVKQVLGQKDFEGNFMQTEQCFDSPQGFSQGESVDGNHESIDMCDIPEPQYDVEITVGVDNMTKVEEITNTGTDSFIVIEAPE
ncbi:uncharacterized protein [Palaemon carinicauda]|uniref:uncharacterized protein n=1 Tax=Palaemon carinicauda TaxID=392227 RepID=UPI0035B5E70E